MLTIVGTAMCQTLRYDVIKGSKNLGEMTVTRSYEDDQIIYDIASEVTFRLLFSFSIDFISYANYQDGILQKEYSKNELNGKVQKEADLKKLENGYHFVLDGISTNLTEDISYSISAIYYNEPSDGQEVFSPSFGQYFTFKKVGYGKYEMQSPDGLNTYEYENGICTRVEVFRDFAKFSFEMSPNTLLAVKNKSINSSEK